MRQDIRDEKKTTTENSICCTTTRDIQAVLAMDNKCVDHNYDWHHEKICFSAYAKTKAVISCTVTVELNSAFVFAI